MKATHEQLLQLGEIVARCDVARMLDTGAQAESASAVVAGLVTAAAILLPKSQWPHFVMQMGLDTHRLREIAALIPKAEVTSEPLPL